MRLTEEQYPALQARSKPVVNWCVFGIDDEFRMWVPRAKCVDKWFAVEHRFNCGKCGAAHSRFRDRARTRQAAYCLSCHAQQMRVTRPKHRELSDDARRKANARARANEAQRRGLLVQSPCEKCGDPNSQKHHDDYGKPLDVHWLCRACHLAEHANEEALEAA